MSKVMQFKARIKNLALKDHVSAQAVLQNFMLERLLERISKSPYKDKFVLKGGMLIASLVGIDSRTTMDMDATVLGFPLSDESLQAALSDICEINFALPFQRSIFHPMRSQILAEFFLHECFIVRPIADVHLRS